MTDEASPPPPSAAPAGDVPDATETIRSVTEALTASDVLPEPSAPLTVTEPPDPIVAEIVRREISQIGRVRQHLPPNFDELPLPIRNRLYSQVEAALQPEPDLGWIEGAEFLEPPEPTDWLITDLITSAKDGGRVLVAGPEKSFKSLFATGCLVAIASGQPLFGYDPWSVPQAGDVLAFMGEGGREWNRSRVVRLMDGLGFTQEQKINTAGHIRMATVPLTPPERFALKLEKQLDERDWKLVIVDSLYVFGGTTERSQLAQMGTLLVQWAELCERQGATLMVVDHFRKAAEALELASVSGVGASQWAQAWALMRAKYDATADSTVMKLKTGARQSGGGVYQLDIVGIMNGPILVKTDVSASDDDDDDDDELSPKDIRAEALIALNRISSDENEWIRVTELKKRLKCSDDVIEYLEDQPHVAKAESSSGRQRWLFAVGADREMPKLLPSAASRFTPAAFTAEESPEESPEDEPLV
jgi:hypothetical protein